VQEQYLIGNEGLIKRRRNDPGVTLHFCSQLQMQLTAIQAQN